MSDRTTGGFGARLRDARERRGVSLRQIANATKISIAALEALERDEISKLPGGIFSRAFVRSYAIEVGLDPEATIQEFIAQFPNDSVVAGHPTSDQFEDRDAFESERRTAGTFLWLAGISIPLAGVVVYLATTGRPLIRNATSPAPAASAKAPAAEPAVPAAAVAQPPENAAPASAPSAPEPTAPDAATPAAAPASSTAAPSAAAPVPEAATPAPDGAAADAGDHLAVRLAARRPCWVTAIVDGRKTIDRLLQSGERATLDVRREMVVTAGDAGALAVTLNGADARPLGKSGEVVTVVVNLTNYRTYLQSR